MYALARDAIQICLQRSVDLAAGLLPAVEFLKVSRISLSLGLTTSRLLEEKRHTGITLAIRHSSCLLSNFVRARCMCDHEPLPNLLIFGIVFLLVTARGLRCQIPSEMLGKFAVTLLRSYLSLVLIYSFK